MNVQDPEALVQCPYEKVHMIRRKRMPYHLQKCRRNYQGQAFKVCPFNARHEVPEPEYHHHLVHCPNKCMVEKDMIHIKRLQEDAVYREKYEGGLGVRSSIGGDGAAADASGSCWNDGYLPRATDRIADELSRDFDRGVRFDTRQAPSPQPEFHWFEDSPQSQRLSEPSRREQSTSSPRDRRRRLLEDKRRPATESEMFETSDYGSDGLEGSLSTPGWTETRAATSRPRTEPVTLQMIKVFGRGCVVNSGEVDRRVGFGVSVSDDDAAASFGARFPPSLGRGVMRTPSTVGTPTTTPTATVTETTAPTAYQAALKQNVLRSLRVNDDDGGDFEDSISEQHPDSLSRQRLDSPDDYPQGSPRQYQERRTDVHQWQSDSQEQYRERQYQRHCQQRQEEHQLSYRDDSPTFCQTSNVDADLPEDRRPAFPDATEVRRPAFSDAVENRRPAFPDAAEDRRPAFPDAVEDRRLAFPNAAEDRRPAFPDAAEDRQPAFPDAAEDRRPAFPDAAEVRQLGYANFPSFQRGSTPRYSSTFCADRPLSKQAQIQLAQQELMEGDDFDDYARHLRRGKRGKNAYRGGGRRFQFGQQRQHLGDDGSGGESERKFAFGRGVGFGRGSSFNE